MVIGLLVVVLRHDAELIGLFWETDRYKRPNRYNRYGLLIIVSESRLLLKYKCYYRLQGWCLFVDPPGIVFAGLRV